MKYPSESVDALGFTPIGLDMPYGIIVQNNPVNKIDPNGQNYLDLNFSFGTIITIGGIPIPLGMTGGIMLDDHGNILPYLGGGLMNPGLGVSLMWPKKSCDEPVPGWTISMQGGAGLVGQLGHSYGDGSNWKEWGIGTPGAGVTGYFVFSPIHLGK
jgi:hypothetical protein